MQIRQFRKEDESELAAIYLKCRVRTFNWLPESIFRLDNFAEHTEGEVILVAIQGNEIAGFISLWVADNFIHHLYLREKFQGNGLGDLLLKEGLKGIGRPARLKCVVRNAKACAFYERRGWKVESTSEDNFGPYHTYVLK